VLSNKLARPRLPPSYVPRPRVNDLLAAGSTKPVTVMSAGAGWGKTLVTAEWAASESASRPVAWISLDPGDDEPGRFWSCFVGALRGAGVLPADNPLARLVPGLGSPDESFRRLVSGLNALRAEAVVVLDDFQLVTDATVLSQFADLLRHPVPHLRLVLLTRSDPALPLHRLRVADDLTEIRSRDLAFGITEAAVLLSAHHVAVGLGDAALLVDRTEGWPAGLRLAALFLSRPEPGRSIGDFTGDDRAVSTYLAEEVLGSLAPELRRFLLWTSVAERLTSGLAEVLTGQSHCQQNLEELEASNAFVVGLGSGREWFRYHSLLREMLHHRLLVEQPDVVPDLQRQAARWFGAQGYPIDALRHAADAGDWPLLGELFVTQACPLLVSVERTRLGKELGRIPGDRLADSADLALCAAARTFLAGRFEDMQPHLDVAAAHMTAAPPRAASGTRLAHDILSMAVARAHGDVAAVTRAGHEALTALSGPDGSLPAAAAYRVVALNNLGTGLLWSGDISGALECLREALVAAEDTDVEVARVNALGHVALAVAASGHTEQAVEYAARAIELVEARGWDPLPQAATAYLALAMVHLRRNELDLARSLIEQGQRAGNREVAARSALGLALARLHASVGKVEAAREELMRAASDLDGHDDIVFLARWRRITEAEIDLAAGDPAIASTRIGPPTNREPPFAQELVCLARSALAAGDPRRAEETLSPLRDAAEGGSALVDVWLMTALAADRLREDNRALEALRRALRIAEPAGVRQPFVTFDPEAAHRLLTRLKEVGPDLTDLIDDLLAEMGRRARSDEAVALTEPLTDRERSVLLFLPTMMTNSEISAELFVSVNTVKAHLKRIYRKLDVDSRRQAVRRARDLGLLGSPDTMSNA
jgi:LuxR family transcriptional regulator, maltose regulon positive regulatory protein